MALKVELKPGERFILGDSIITNDDQRTRLFIEGDAPILREKDILRLDDADTPCKKIYLMLQMMYLAPEPTQHHELYFQLVKDVMEAAPSTTPMLDNINNKILTGELYKALKETRKLIEYERELLQNVKTA
ncbi:MAG: flagellar biosynthesis repressor FlbT [Parvibaculum sp.]|uniref:flagellar biosynthesis repressor FlbT n=1 Tax=Parvibaculum sp. TaxID=2024848 RepID=UPI003C769E74